MEADWGGGTGQGIFSTNRRSDARAAKRSDGIAASARRAKTPVLWELLRVFITASDFKLDDSCFFELNDVTILLWRARGHGWFDHSQRRRIAWAGRLSAADVVMSEATSAEERHTWHGIDQAPKPAMPKDLVVELGFDLCTEQL